MDLRALLGGKQPPPAETLRKALAEAEAEAAAVETETAALREKRRTLLVNGLDDSALDQVEAELNRVYRRQDRASLLISSLEERIQEAEAAEHRAEGVRIRAEAVAARDEGLTLIERYATLAREMTEVLAGIEAAEHKITLAGVQLHARDDFERLQGVEATYFEGKEIMAQFPPPSILDGVRLPDPETPRALLWPRGPA